MKKMNLMKGIILSAILCVSQYFSAQAPEKMSYQAVIRNSSNTLVSNQSIGMRISLLQGSTNGTAVYEETQNPTSNANGLVSIEIGGGTIVSGSFSTIDWANGPYYIKTETDPTGGTNYTITGTSQLLGVPYALYAKIAENVNLNSGIGISMSGNTISAPNADSWITNGDTTYTYKKVIIGNNASSTFGSSAIPFKIIGSDVVNAASKSRLGIYRVDPSTGGAAIELRRAFGTSLTSLQPTNNGATLGSLAFGGYDGSIFPDAGSLISAVATEAYSPTTLGSNLLFYTTPDGGSARVKRLTITQSGSVIYQPLATAPTSPVKGETYFDSTLNKLRVWDGTVWQNCW